MTIQINFYRVNEDGIITHVAGVIPTVDNPKPECNSETIAWCPVDRRELHGDGGLVWQLREAIKWFGMFNWTLPPKPTAERHIDFDNVRQIMNPYGGGTHTCECGGMARVFIESMLAFPRFETPDGAIELGGADYLTASENAGRGKSKAAGAAGDFKSVDERLADDERRECGFTRKVAAFNAYVDWVGVHAGCGRAAQGVVLAVDRLAGALRECGIRQITHIDRAAGEVQTALAELCRALGDAENAGAMAKGGARADKGGKRHRVRKVISGAWRSAADVADDFNRAAFAPEPGARKMGTCNELKINRWDAEYPDEQHKSKFGYYARLRIEPDLKDEYHAVLRRWAAYWSDYKADFKAWRKTHPKSPRSGYRFKPMGKRTDIDPERIGLLPNGATVVRPETDAEIMARDRNMRKRGIRRDYTHLPHSNH